MSSIRSVLDNQRSTLVSSAGLFTAVLESVEDYLSQTEGECLKARLRVTEGEQEDQLIVAILSKASHAAFRIRQLVEACGKDPETIQDTDELIGSQVWVRVVEDTYQGETRLKALSFKRLG